MRELPPEDEKPEKNGFSINPRPGPKPEPKPRSKPTPKPVSGSDRRPKHSEERERRQVKLAKNVRSRSGQESADKNPYRGCGCLIIVAVIVWLLVLMFR